MGLHSKSGAEKLGFWLTLICGIHCIATPILITFLPMLGSKFEAFHKYETVLIYLSLILAFYLLWKDYKIHNNFKPVGLIIAASFATVLQKIISINNLELFFSISISAFIITAYWLNWKHKTKCKCKLSH